MLALKFSNRDVGNLTTGAAGSGNGDQVKLLIGRHMGGDLTDGLSQIEGAALASSGTNNDS